MSQLLVQSDEYPELFGVRDVRALEGLHVRVVFTDGSERTLDLDPYLHGPLFEPIRRSRTLIERDAEGCYIGSVPDLKGCHTQAKSLDTLIKRMRAAIELCLEVEAEHVTPNEFDGVQRVLVEP